MASLPAPVFADEPPGTRPTPSVAAPKASNDQKPVAPIIIKKVTVVAAAGHHGGAWKVAYADFVTAMMAFFLLMWIIGATTEDQRKGIADYFTPTLISHKNSGGSNGVGGGRSIIEPQGNAPYAKRAGSPIKPVAGPSGSGAGDGGKLRGTDRQNFSKIVRSISARIQSSDALAALKDQVKFTVTDEGLRIEIIDRAGFSMFGLGTNDMTPKAAMLIDAAAQAISPFTNKVSVRGHTDSVPYSQAGMNNWKLSSERAEVSRAALQAGGVAPDRFARLEGVADTEPFNPADPYDPRNRRISVTLLYRDAGAAPAPADGAATYANTPGSPHTAGLVVPVARRTRPAA